MKSQLRYRLNPGAVAFGFAAVTAILLAGCGSSGSSSAASAAGSSALASAGSAAARAAIPLRVVRTPGGRVTLLADISVGGGPATEVIVDTGSAGLIIERHAIGPGFKPGPLRLSVKYVGLTVSAQVGLAAVSLRGASQAVLTPPVKIGVTSQHLPLADRIGAAGILGIAPGGNQPGQFLPLLSPLVQLGSPLADGFTVSAGHQSLQLGLPAVSPGSTQIALTEAGFSYPDGHPAYDKSVRLCWSVGSRQGCGPTSLDTGGAAGIVSSSILPGAPHSGSSITGGTAIKISSGTGATLCSFTAGSGSGNTAPNYMPFPVMNSGTRIFLADSVGYNLETGTMVITPDPSGRC